MSATGVTTNGIQGQRKIRKSALGVSHHTGTSRECATLTNINMTNRMEREAMRELDELRRQESEERNAKEWDEDSDGLNNLVDTHKAIMRAMGLDEKYETQLWDSTHGL